MLERGGASRAQQDALGQVHTGTEALGNPWAPLLLCWGLAAGLLLPAAPRSTAHCRLEHRPLPATHPSHTLQNRCCTKQACPGHGWGERARPEPRDGHSAPRPRLAPVQGLDTVAAKVSPNSESLRPELGSGGKNPATTLSAAIHSSGFNNKWAATPPKLRWSEVTEHALGRGDPSCGRRPTSRV